MFLYLLNIVLDLILVSNYYLQLGSKKLSGLIFKMDTYTVRIYQPHNWLDHFCFQGCSMDCGFLASHVYFFVSDLLCTI